MKPESRPEGEKVPAGTIEAAEIEAARDNIVGGTIETIATGPNQQTETKQSQQIHIHLSPGDSALDAKLHERPPKAPQLKTLAHEHPESPSVAAKISVEFSSYRDPVIYHVKMSDEPPANSNFTIASSVNDYLFYDALVDYTRYPPWPGDHLLIAAITDPSTYADWVRTDNVVYREIIGMSPLDAKLFLDTEKEIESARTNEGKLRALSKKFEIEIKVGGRPAMLDSFKRHPFGYVLSFQNPKDVQLEESARYEFFCQTFQPRSMRSFAFIASELFRNLSYKFNYQEVGDARASEIFSAFLFDPSEEVKVLHDVDGRVLSVQSTGDSWVYPGGGIVVFWS